MRTNVLHGDLIKYLRSSPRNVRSSAVADGGATGGGAYPDDSVPLPVRMRTVQKHRTKL